MRKVFHYLFSFCCMQFATRNPAQSNDVPDVP